MLSKTYYAKNYAGIIGLGLHMALLPGSYPHVVVGGKDHSTKLKEMHQQKISKCMINPAMHGSQLDYYLVLNPQ